MRSRAIYAAAAAISIFATTAANAQSPQPDGPADQSSSAAVPDAQLPTVVVTDEADAPKKPVKKAAKRKAKAKAVKSASAPSTPAPQPPPAAPVELSETFTPPQGTNVVIGADAATLTTATAREFNANPGATLTDTLETKPGVAGSAFAPGVNRPILRGLDDNRVRVQENGLNVGGVSDLSEDHAIPVSPCGTDSVSIIRGPAALLYSDKVVGGVVNAENQVVPTYAPASGFATEIQGGLTSGDNGRDGCFRTSAGASAGTAGFVAHAEGFARKSDDYDTPHGRQLNSAVDNTGYSVGGSYIWNSGFLGVAYSRLDSLYGIPGDEAVEENARIDMGQDKITAKGEWRVRDFGIEAIRGWFGYSDYAHNEVVDEGAGDEVGSRFLNREYEGRVEVQHARRMTPLGALTGVAGIQISTRDLTGMSFEGDNLLEPSRTRKVAGFLLEELQLSDPLKLSTSLRIEQSDISGATYDDPLAALPALRDYDRDFTSASAGVGLTYDLSYGIVARMSATYSERAPEAQELFSKGAHEATGTFEIGNPDLKEERATALELGFKRALGSFRFDTSVFYNKYDGFIYRRFTGAMCDDDLASCGAGGSELDQVIFGQRDATFYGVELQGEKDIAEIWNGVWGVSAQYDFVHATFEAGGYVPRMPPHRLGGGLYYRDAYWAAKLDVLHAFDQNDTAFGETPTDGYTLVNAELTHTIQLGDSLDGRREFTIGIRGDNLLDDDVRFSTSFKKDEVLQPGRSVRLFGSLKF